MASEDSGETVALAAASRKMETRRMASSGSPHDKLTAPALPSQDAGGLDAMIRRALADKGKGRGAPPVDKWNPPFCGDIDMRIAADGTWFYLGTPIGREALVKLFASVLRKDEDGKTYLVTPVEKVGITVEDAPFQAVEMEMETTLSGHAAVFRTNVGDVVAAGPDHPLRFRRDEGNDGIVPYIHIRGRLEARVTRAVTYDLMGLGEEGEVDGARWFGVRSAGVFFPIVPAEDARG
jgi:uncharacterized protein